MKNSIYNTSQEAKHDKFRKRLKEECEKKHLTAVGLANKLGYTVHAVNGWCKSSGGFPSYSVLVQLSELFDCDVAYLMGEIDCRHISTQHIADLTGLSPESAAILESGNNSMIDAIISNKDYALLMARAWQYTHSQYTNGVSVNDESGLDIGSIDNGLSARDVLKASAADVFSRILDSIYNDNDSEMQEVRKAKQLSDDEKNLADMLRSIHRYHEIAEGDSSIKEKLLSIIKGYLSGFQTEEMSLWKQAEPDTIYNSYKLIAEYAGVDLDNRS